MNEQIWVALDEENNFEAAQLYLLALHIHTGIYLHLSHNFNNKIIPNSRTKLVQEGKIGQNSTSSTD